MPAILKVPEGKQVYKYPHEKVFEGGLRLRGFWVALLRWMGRGGGEGPELPGPDPRRGGVNKREGQARAHVVAYSVEVSEESNVGGLHKRCQKYRPVPRSSFWGVYSLPIWGRKGGRRSLEDASIFNGGVA